MEEGKIIHMLINISHAAVLLIFLLYVEEVRVVYSLWIKDYCLVFFIIEYL